jgi:hypothetical protein
MSYSYHATGHGTISGEAVELAYVYGLTEQLLGRKGFRDLDEPENYDPGTQPWLVRPIGFLDFFEVNAITSPVVGASATVLTFTVPRGYDGVIEYLGNYLTGGGFVDASGDLVWRILADDRAIKNFGNITTQLGNLLNPSPIRIRIYSGQVIKFTLSHIANAALDDQCICLLKGYYYPRKGE